MEPLPIAYTTIGCLVGLVALIKVGIPVWKWFGSAIDWFRDLFTVVRGREARVDRATGEEIEEVPSLVDALVEFRREQRSQGKSIDNLTTVVTQVADQQITLGEHTKQIADLRLATAIHAEQIGALKLAADERTAMHQETASLFDAIAKRDSDVIDPQEEP